MNEIPPEERFKNPVTCGLWFGKKKPNMTALLTAFTNMVDDLSINGINCRINNQNRKIYVYALYARY